MDYPVQDRNMVAQVLLFIVTLGIYSIYWFYVTAREMKGLADDHQAEPGLWTILLFIPLANIFAFYKYSELYEKISSDHFNRWILFLLWLVFSPAVWIIVQMELNRIARSGQTAVVQG